MTEPHPDGRDVPPQDGSRASDGWSAADVRPTTDVRPTADARPTTDALPTADVLPHRSPTRPPPLTPAAVLGPAVGLVAMLLLVALVVSPAAFSVRLLDGDRPVDAAPVTAGTVPLPSGPASPSVPAARPAPEVPLDVVAQAHTALQDVLGARDEAVRTGDVASWLRAAPVTGLDAAGGTGGPAPGPSAPGDPPATDPVTSFGVLTSMPVTTFASSLVPDSLAPSAATPGAFSGQVRTDFRLGEGPVVRRTDVVTVRPVDTDPAATETMTAATDTSATAETPATATPDLADPDGDGWQVVSWRPYPPLGQLGTAAPWDLGPVDVTQGERSVVLSWPGDDGDGDDARRWGRDVSGWADEGAVTVDSYLGSGWPRVSLLLVPATDVQYDALVPGPATPGTDVFAAVTTDVQTPDGGGDLVVLNPYARQDLVPQTWQVTVTHELVHVASGALYGDSQEIWLAEGLADLVGWSDVVPATASREQVAARLLQRVDDGRADLVALPDAAAFADADPDVVGDAYEGSWLACLLLLDEVGLDGLLQVYAEASDGDGDAADRTDAALVAATGEGRDAFRNRWYAYLAGLGDG